MTLNYYIRSSTKPFLKLCEQCKQIMLDVTQQMKDDINLNEVTVVIARGFFDEKNLCFL